VVHVGLVGGNVGKVPPVVALVVFFVGNVSRVVDGDAVVVPCVGISDWIGVFAEEPLAVVVGVLVDASVVAAVVPVGPVVLF